MSIFVNGFLRSIGGRYAQLVAQTKHVLPQYYVIGDHLEEVLMTTFVDMAPAARTLQNIEDAKYMMTQRPLAKETTLTHVDLLRLPDDFKDIKIVPITLLAEAVPAGLISGDRISLYDRSKDANSPNGLIEAVVVEVEPMSRPVTDGVKLDVTRLTLAVQSNDLNYFISLPNCSADNLLCIVLQPPETAGLPFNPAGGPNVGHSSSEMYR